MGDHFSGSESGRMGSLLGTYTSNEPIVDEYISSFFLISLIGLCLLFSCRL